MKENYTQLYPNEKVAKAVGDYAFEHSTELPKPITDHHAWGSENHPMAHYMISPLQCQVSILEIGTFIGFSTMGWAEAVGDDGRVTALEFSPEYAATAEEAFAKNGIKNIDIIIGDARLSLQNLDQKITEAFDLIFIDADKQSYPQYLNLLLAHSTPGSPQRLLKKGGIILADNILRRGLIADSSDANPWAASFKQQGKANDEEVKALDEFNKRMAQDLRLETFLMPMFDGLGMGRLVD